VGLLVLATWSALNTRNNMIEERKAGLQRVVDAAEGLLKSYAADVTGGKLSVQDARRSALERIAAMRYDDANYIFVVDSKPVVLMHPTSKGLVGKNVSDRKDSDGKLYYLDMVRVARQQQRGFVEYMGRLLARMTANALPNSVMSCITSRGTGFWCPAFFSMMSKQIFRPR